MARVVNGTKLSVGQFLKKGGSFTVSIPSGVIEDLNNHPLDGVKKSFTCLAEKADYGPPDVAMISPVKDMQTIPSTSSMVHVYFTENIQAGTGSITVRKGNTMHVVDIANKVNITIDGPKLFAQFSSSWGGPDAGEFTVVLPAGIVRDEAGIGYGGL